MSPRGETWETSRPFRTRRSWMRSARSQNHRKRTSLSSGTDRSGRIETDEKGERMSMTLESRLEEEAPLGRRLLAEFVGAALLVAIGAGAVTVFLLGPLRELAA